MPNSMIITEARRVKDADASTKLPLRGIVDRALPSLDAVNVDMALAPGDTRLKVLHPYIGINSWIRVMPDAGTSLITVRRGDDVREDIIKYVNDNPDEKIRRYKEGEILYRILDAGEIEIMSSGRAYAFFGNKGDVELRGGAIRHELLQSKLEMLSISPTYSRRLHKATPTSLAHQEKFGVIKRPDQSNPNTLQKYVRDANDKFMVEYGRWLHSTEDKPLVEQQEGYVVDVQGQVVKQASTNKPLRHVRTYYHKDSGEIVTQIDEEMNVYIKNSTKAPETKVNLGDKNVLRVSCQDMKFEVTKTGDFKFDTSLKLKSPNTTIDASTSYTAKSAQIRLNSADVGFGSAPSQPMALAQPIITALQSSLNSIAGVFDSLAAIPIPTAPAASAALKATAGTLSQIASTQVKATA